MNVYSNAFNFSSYLSGSVDPRTGQYGCQINLAQLSPQGALEVNRSIALSFSMLGPESSLYGKGWRLSNTEFDLATSKLTLLSGEQFQTQGMPSVKGTMIIKDRKLQDLVVKRPDESTLHVIYKDGTIEVLQRTNSTLPYRITSIKFENGETLSFRYSESGALERILNHKQEELLVLTYGSGRLQMADARVDGGRYARMLFTQSNGRLTAVTAPYDRNGAPGTAAYNIVYRDPFRNGLVAIDRMQLPMGGEEKINYTENGHQYANNQFIPRVSSWTLTPGSNQPRITRTYGYSPGLNFTGFPYAGGFREGEDNLYLVGSAYDYWTEEKYLGMV